MPVEPIKELEELKIQWYFNTAVKFEIIKAVKYRESIFLSTAKKLTHRCLKINALKFLDMNMERYLFFEPSLCYNYYCSLATYPEMPMFSYNQQKKMEEMQQWNLNALSHIKSYDLAFDIDNVQFEKAYATASRLKAMLDEFQVSYNCKFSVAGSTPVMVENQGKVSVLPISEAVKIAKNIKVLSLNKNKNVEFARVTDTLRHKKNTFAVYHSKSNIPIKITQDHSLMFLSDKLEITEKKITDNLKGQYLITYNTARELPKETPKIDVNFSHNGKPLKQKITLTKELMELVGYYLGDGFVSLSSTINFTLGKHQISDADRLRYLIQHLPTDYLPFNEFASEILKLKSEGMRPCNIVRKMNGKCSEAFTEQVFYRKRPKFIRRERKSYVYLTKKNVRRVTFHSTPIYRFLIDNFGKYAHKKCLPTWVFRLPKPMIMALLRGYIQTDGHSSEYEIRIKSVSFQLIRQFVWLLKMNGVSCSLLYEKLRPHRLPQGTIFKGSEVYILCVPKSELARTLYHRKKVKFAPETSNNLLPTKPLKILYKKLKPYGISKNRNIYNVFKKPLASKSRILSVLNWFFEEHKNDLDSDDTKIINKYFALMTSDIGICKIRKIEKCGIEQVYDFSVEGTENFFAGDYPILAHNSGTKGFHLVIPFENLPPQLKSLPLPEMCAIIKQLAYELKIYWGLKDLDMKIYDLRRIWKTPYSVVYPYYYVAMPLSDEQFEHFRLEDVWLPNLIDKADSVRDRGLMTRERPAENLMKFIRHVAEKQQHKTNLFAIFKKPKTYLLQQRGKLW
jgi:intein/homing endonuclease